MFVVLENRSGRADLTPHWIDGFVDELTAQAAEFCARYGLAAWALVADASIAPTDSPRLALLPTSDVADALGYHDKDPKGRPYGRVFTAGETLDGISETASHEFLELLGDLEADEYTQAPDGRMHAREACDAVQGSPYRGPRGYLLANYVTPAWYEPEMGPPYDHRAELRAPLSRLDSGYMILTDGVSVTTDPPMAHAARHRSHATSRLSKRQRVAARRQKEMDSMFRVIDPTGIAIGEAATLEGLLESMIEKYGQHGEPSAKPPAAAPAELDAGDAPNAPVFAAPAAPATICQGCGHPGTMHRVQAPHDCLGCNCGKYVERAAG